MFISKIKSLFGIGDNAGSKEQRQNATSNRNASGGNKSYEGSIKHLNYSRGYGFIQCRDFDRNIFVHFSDCNDKVRKGDRVSFTVTEEERGPRANNVTVIS